MFKQFNIKRKPWSQISGPGSGLVVLDPWSWISNFWILSLRSWVLSHVSWILGPRVTSSGSRVPNFSVIITECDKSLTGITKFDSCCKVWWKIIIKCERYYKVWPVLQSETEKNYKVWQILQSVTRCRYKVWQV